MRILFIGVLALLLLAGTDPVTITPTANIQKLELAKPGTSLSMNSNINYYRGNSFRRFRPDTGSRTADNTLNGQWYLQPVLPSDTAAGQFPALNFNLKKKTFSGHTGCNTMQGSFVLTDSSFCFNDNIRVTRKVCSGYNEGAFLKNLFMANRYTIRDSVLTLWFDQTELSRWTRKPQRELLIKSA